MCLAIRRCCFDQECNFVGVSVRCVNMTDTTPHRARGIRSVLSDIMCITNGLGKITNQSRNFCFCRISCNKNCIKCSTIRITKLLRRLASRRSNFRYKFCCALGGWFPFCPTFSSISCTFSSTLFFCRSAHLPLFSSSSLCPSLPSFFSYTKSV